MRRRVRAVALSFAPTAGAVVLRTSPVELATNARHVLGPDPDPQATERGRELLSPAQSGSLDRVPHLAPVESVNAGGNP